MMPTTSLERWVPSILVVVLGAVRLEVLRARIHLTLTGVSSQLFKMLRGFVAHPLFFVTNVVNDVMSPDESLSVMTMVLHFDVILSTGPGPGKHILCENILSTSPVNAVISCLLHRHRLRLRRCFIPQTHHLSKALVRC